MWLQRAVYIAVLTLALVAGACGDDSGPATGSEGGPCFADGTCDGELVCLSDLCVALPCTLDDTRPCTCAGEEDGVETCLADETWSACECEAPCGNGLLDAGEACDGTSLDGADCQSEGFDDGELACAGDCTFDTSACIENTGECGNDVLETGEACDGADLGGETCETQSLFGTGLACATDCTFDTSACATCAETQATIPQVPTDLVVMVDRSGSMIGANWTGTVSALTQYFNDPSSAGVGAALTFFPVEAGDACDSANYNPPHVALGTLPGHTNTLVNALSSTSPGGSTPTYAALMGTLQYATAHKDLNPTHAVVVILASDGDPTLCDTSIPSIAALAASAYNYNGTTTHAIAIQGATLANLAIIAQAGGGQAHDVTSDITQFQQALNDIRSATSSCTRTLPVDAQNDPTNVNVDFTPTGGSPTLLGRADGLADCGNQPGWYADDPIAPTFLYLCPDSCTAHQNDPGSVLEVYVGCPSVPN